MDKVKVTITAVISALKSWLGILAVLVFLLPLMKNIKKKVEEKSYIVEEENKNEQ